MPENTPAPVAAKELDGHELKAIIVQTPRSTVYQALQRDKNKVVVLKALSPALAKQAEKVKAFMESAKAASKLAHPNVVRLFRAGSDKGVPFVTMEFVEGPNLESVLQKKGKLPPSAVGRLLLQGLSALDAAEKAALRHGHIQPSHCLMAPGRNLKLIGYIGSGLPEDEEKHLPFYMSPEEATNEHSPDHRSDLYSLGATFYHALCGTPPFVSDNPVQLRINIAEQPLVPPVEEDPALPRGISDVLTRMLARNPDQRYQSAVEALEALKAVAPAESSGEGPSLAEPPLQGGIAAPPLPGAAGATASAQAGSITGDFGSIAAGGEAPGATTQAMQTHIPTVDLTPESMPAAKAIPIPDQPAFAEAPAFEEGGAPPAQALPAGVAVAPGRGSLSRKLRTIWLSLLWTVIILSVCGGGFYFYFYKLSETGGPVARTLKDGSAECLAALDEAILYETQQPGDFVGAISAFQKVMDSCPGTIQAGEAKKNIDKLMAAFNKAAEEEWVTVSAQALGLMKEEKHKDCYNGLKDFQKKYFGAQIGEQCAKFLEDLKDRNLSLIDRLYKEAESLSPKDQRDEIEIILLKMAEVAIPDNLKYAGDKVQKYRDYYLEKTGGPGEGEAVELAKRLYEDYRREMQMPARMNDHESALKEIGKFVAEMEKQYQRAQKDQDKTLWDQYRKWAEVDRKSIETIRKRWDKAVQQWFEDHKGKRVKAGTTQGILEDYKEGRLYIRNAKDVFTEPSGVLATDKIFAIAFPQREELIGEEIMEKGWWLLYQEDISGAKNAERNARELRAETGDLKQAIDRWVYTGWQLDPLFAAKGSSNPDGRVQLFYDFSSRDQATDWFAMEGEFQIVAKTMFPVGTLSDNGCYIQSQFPIVEDMEMSMEVKFESQESVVRLGFMRPEGRYLEYHYVELSPRRVGYWIGKHVTRSGGDADKPKAIQPLPIKEKQHVKLEWKGDTLTLYVEQRQVNVYKYPKTGVWMPLIGSKEDKLEVDNILLVGKPDPGWLTRQQPALWLAQEKRRREDWHPLFNGKNLEGWKQHGRGSWKVLGDNLEGDGINPTLEIGQQEWRNYIVSAKVRIQGGSTVRLFVRRDPGKDGTEDASQFVFTCGAYVDCGIRIKSVYDWAKQNDLVGAWHTHWHELTVSAKGDFYSVFIDGRLYHQVESSKRPSGKVAIYTNQPSSWQDIKIRLLDQ